MAFGRKTLQHSLCKSSLSLISLRNLSLFMILSPRGVWGAGERKRSFGEIIGSLEWQKGMIGYN